MSLPNFILAGVPKAGSASYHAILSRHPEIHMAIAKEVHFFDENENFNRGEQWYRNHFKAASEAKAIGEATPSYLYFDYVPKRIKELLGGGTKIIFSFRHPVDRAYSEFLHNQRRGLVQFESFEEGIEAEKKAINTSVWDKRYFRFIEKGHYARFLQPWLEQFPEENFLFTLFEDDFIANRKRVLNEIQAFLELTQVDLEADAHLNKVFIPKNKSLYKWMNTRNGLRKTFRKLVPFAALRKKMRLRMNEFNSSDAVPPKLNKTLRQELYEEHYAAEMGEFARLTQLDLSCWESSTQVSKEI